VFVEISGSSATLVLNDPDGRFEYSIDGGAVWNDIPHFTGLSWNSEYTISVRLKETDNFIASDPIGVSFRTPILGDAGFSGRKEAIVVPEAAGGEGSYGIRLERNVVSVGAGGAAFTVSAPGNFTASVAVYDNMGNAVFTKSGVKRGERIVWNLTGVAGRSVAAGSYLIVATARDGNGNGKAYRYTARLGVGR